MPTGPDLLSGISSRECFLIKSLIVALIEILVLSIFMMGAFLLVFPAVSVAKGNIDKIVGPNACAECHKHETEVWKGTHHFKTFRKMPRSKEATKIAGKMKIRRLKTNKLCQQCHFTVQNVKRKVQATAGISCESCHAEGKDYLKVHAEFGGKKDKKDETANEARDRWRKSEAAGMIRPEALYNLAKNCYGCHVVPEEKLVNVGGHPAGSPFELVSWSQGEVRHNLWYSDGKSNKKANAARRRLMYAVGIAMELETALRAIARATIRKTYAFKMARRAARARSKMAAIAKVLPEVSEVAAIAELGHSSGLKLNNAKALTLVADNISLETLKLISNHNGEKLTNVDSLIPTEKKYKGSPVK